jgi:group I intron endonuclease
MIGIYKITSPSGRVYIGQSIDIEKRFNQYKNWNIKKQIKLHNSFLKYNVNKHIFEIIEECNIDSLNGRERYWQEFYISVENGLNCLYTKTEIKRAHYGKDSYERRSLALKGVKKSKPVWNKGKTNVYTKETLEKMSNCKKGKTLSTKGVKKPQMSGKNHPLYGVKKPEFSANQKGDKNHMYGKTAINAKEVINIITQEVFSSIKEAAIFYNLKYSTLQQKINGIRKNNTNLKFKNHDD